MNLFSMHALDGHHHDKPGTRAMSDRHQGRGVQLVSLMKGLPNAKSRDRLLTLATHGSVHLFVAVPPGQVVYGESLGLGASRSYHQAQALAKIALGAEGIAYPAVYLDIRFLALKPSQAAALQAAGTVNVHWFQSGLQLHAADKDHLNGWLEPHTLFPPFCLRPAKQAEEDALLPPDPIMDALPAHTLTIGLEDIYIDAQVPAALMSGAASAEVVDDPHELVDRAPGVFVLYCAAKHFYGAQASPQGSRDEVFKWLQSQSEKKLYNKTVTGQLAKLIDPSYRRGSGVGEKDQKAFDKALIQSQEFSAKYKRDSFITDALALILHVTDWWHDKGAENAKSESPKSKATLRNDLHEKLEALGFYGKEELEAIRRMVMWPDR